MSPLVWIYAEASMERQCPNCRAEPNEYCRRPDGYVRRIPCIARIPHVDPAVQPIDDHLNTTYLTKERA